MSLYSDLPPASDEPLKPSTEGPATTPTASLSPDDKATAGCSAKPPLLIPQINIIRQRPRPVSEAPRKKPLMMKVVKPAAPIVNMMRHDLPPAPSPAELSRKKEEAEEKAYDEYDPAIPNEYLQLCRERRAERDRLQRERELQEFLKMQEAKQEKQPIEPLDLKMSGEDAYMRRMRMSGVAPAAAPERAPSPPPAPRSLSPEPYNPPVSVSSTQPVAKQSVAERLMAKMGWQSGQGLGAQGQGIKQALVAKKDGSGHLKIAEPGPKQKRQKVDLGSVVLLENMVGKGEVDSELERETAEECKKFGNVLQCRIYERADDVRIFIKFDNDFGSKRALDALNGRLFGGRRIYATSYDAESFSKEDLDL